METQSQLEGIVNGCEAKGRLRAFSANLASSLGSGYRMLEDKVKAGAKSYSVNSLTGVVFYTPLMFAYETLPRAISKITDGNLSTLQPIYDLLPNYSPEESGWIRGKAAVLGLALYGAYGHFRDLCAYLTKTTKDSSERRKTIVETASAYIFNAIVYAGILMHSGADPLDATATSIGGTVLVGLAGRPYGWILDKVRKQFNLQSLYN